MQSSAIKNGGHTIIICSSCQKDLVDIWHTHPNDDFDWVLKAKCCYCGDLSFDYNIKGRFHIGAIVREHEHYDDILVAVKNYYTDDQGRIIIETVKGSN